VSHPQDSGPAPGDATGWLPAADGELSRLIAAMCGGTATRADRDRLEELLRDPAARRAYLAFMQVHGDLQWRYAHPAKPAGHEDEPVSVAARRPELPPPASDRRPAAFAGLADRLRGLVRGLADTLRRPAPLSLILAAILVGGALAVVGSTTWSGRPPQMVTEVVGRITGLHEARWAGADSPPVIWSPLGPGTRLDLAGGLAELSLTGGGRIILQGPAVVQVESPTSVAVERGLVAARYERRLAVGRAETAPAIPLSIRTPSITIDDLGTEFGVGVAADGSAEVHVFEGLVELRPPVMAQDAVPSRLGAGEARQVTRDGRARSVTAGFASRIVRTFPGRTRPEPPPEWIAEEAVVVYADRFTGSGPVAGTAPERRGGVGAAPWHVVGTTWSLDDGLRRTADAKSTGGTVSLPFVPEPGFVYRASVVMDVSAGGRDWGAIGFLDRRDGRFFDGSAAAGYGWMGQRHARDPELGGNFAAAGPGITGKLERIDDKFGRHERMVQLDTRGRSWRAKFFVDGELVAWHVFDRPPPIRFVALGAGANATARFTNFRLEAWKPVGVRGE
jgi:hypothetical protein